jgi:hypothetical protein
MCKHIIEDNKKCRHIAGGFDHHAQMVVVQCRVHCLMELIQGFTRSHWVLPLGECLHHIALAAVKVINFE